MTNGTDNPVARRGLAGLVLTACAGHVWMAISGGPGTLLTVSSLGMAVVCAPCAIRMWECGSRRLFIVVGAMATAMLVTHMVIMSARTMPAMPGMDHANDLSMLATTAVEALVALGVLGFAVIDRFRRVPNG